MKNNFLCRICNFNCESEIFVKKETGKVGMIEKNGISG